MLTTITPNKSQLYKKVALQIILIVIFVLALIIVIHPWGQPLTVSQLLLMILFAIAFLIFNVFLLVQLLYLPIGVSFDDSSKKLEIKFLLIKPIVVQATDMEKYSSTLVATKRKDFEGLLLYIKPGRKILLTNISLKDYKPLEAFLKKLRIKYAGKEVFAFFPYYKQWF